MRDLTNMSPFSRLNKLLKIIRIAEVLISCWLIETVSLQVEVSLLFHGLGGGGGGEGVEYIRRLSLLIFFKAFFTPH